MKVRNEMGDIIAEFQSISRKDDKLFIDTKMLGSMRMDVVLTLEDIFCGLKMLFSWQVAAYLFFIPYFCLRRLFTKLSK